MNALTATELRDLRWIAEAPVPDIAIGFDFQTLAALGLIERFHERVGTTDRATWRATPAGRALLLPSPPLPKEG